MIRTANDALTVAAEWLLLADPAYQYPLAEPGIPPAIAVPLPASARRPESPYATAYLSTEQTTTETVIVRTTNHIEHHDLTQPTPAWDSAHHQTPLTNALASHPSTTATLAALRSATPLAVLRLQSTAGQLRVDVLTCARQRASGTLFARAAELTVTPETSLAHLIDLTLTRCSDLNARIASEWMAYTTHEAGTEIELKFTLTGHRTAWELSRHFAHRTAVGALTDFIPDVGNELQRWHFLQHTFEITDPPEARGYLAFMPDPDGTYLIKRKTFEHDTLRRREDFRNRVPIPVDGLAEFIAREYPNLTTRPLHDFHRTRFDINLESTRTGDCYGIEIDEVVVPDTGAVLRQTEIEYHRTRVHLGMTQATLEPELARLAAIVEQELAALGESTEQSYYSKLSFLREQQRAMAD